MSVIAHALVRQATNTNDIVSIPNDFIAHSSTRSHVAQKRALNDRKWSPFSCTIMNI